MAETTPLGFQVPDGDDPIRNGDDVIANNALKSETLISEARANIANLLQAEGFDGDPLELNDAAVAQALSTGEASSVALDSTLSPKVPPLVASAIANDPTVANSAATMAQSTAGLVPRWKASTAYTAGQMVINPSGDLVTAKANFTSTATYAAANWDLTTAASLLASSIKKGGLLADGTDINTLRTPNVYTVGSASSAATMLNLPFNVAGEIWVGKNDGSNMMTQRAIGRASGGRPEMWTRTALSASTWDVWVPDGQVKGALPDSTNLDTFRTPGTWIITTATSAATMTGLPQINGAQVNESAVVHVVTFPGTSTGEQRITYAADSEGKYKKFERVTKSSSSWPGWQNATPSTTVSPVTPSMLASAGARHALLQQQAYMRRGNLGVQGKAVVSIRFDHWLNDMFAKVLPLMRQYMMPGSICLNSDNMSLDQNNAVTWQQVTNMALYDGIEVWNHGADHLTHTDEAGILDVIIGGQQRLQAAVGPKLIVDGFMTNGSSYYNDYNLGRGPSAFFGIAGQAIQYAHAFSDGKNSGFMQPLDGKIKLGASHMTVEGSPASSAIATIEEVKKHGRGITIYLHPGLIDQPTGMTLADFESLLQYLAAERDAGRIEILTVSGMGVADATHSRREDLLTNTQFANSNEGWTVGAGYTLRSSGGKQLISASATAGNLYQNINLATRFGWAMGGVCELLVPARATGGVESVLRLQVHDTTDDTVFKKERLFTLPADGSTVYCRVFVTIPAELKSDGTGFVTTSLRATLARESGGALDFMDEPHFRPV